MSFILFLTIFSTIHFPIYLYGSTAIIFDTKQYDKGKGKPVTYTDTFSVTNTSTQYTIHVWQGENGQSMAKNGSITLNGQEVVSPKELRNAIGYISKPISLRSNNTLSVKLKGKSGVFLRVRITMPTGPMDPSITISSPFDGETVNRESVMVSGTFNSYLEEVSVMVNGRLAEINEKDYVINNLPLQLGQNSVAARVIEASGYKAEETITIQTDTQDQPVRLSSNITGGVPPLDVKFTIDTNIANPITSYQMDFDGDGNIDYTADNPDDISFTYTANGIYFATATVTDNQGNQYSEQLAVNIISMAELDTLLEKKWIAVGDSLRNKDIQTALSYFVERSRAQYEQGFIVLMDQLPQIFSMPEEFNLISIVDNTAIYENVVDEGGIARSYPVTFIKDENGFWKIKGF